MATYYVRPDGNNANAGTGSTAGQAWQTVQYALTNATLTTGVNYIYIAPGVYRESVTLNITPTSSNTLVISGDPNAAQFSGVTQGVVRLTNFVTDNANPTSSRVFFSNSKSYFTLENIYIDGFRTGDIIDNALVDIKSCTNVTVSKMVVVNTGVASFDGGCYISSAASNTNIVIERSYFMATAALIVALPSSGTVYNPQISIRNCHAIGTYAGIMITANGAVTTTSNGVNVYNCTVYGIGRCIWFNTSNTTTPSTLYNSLLVGMGSTTGITLQTANALIENFNKIRCSSAATNITTFGANTTTAGSYGIDLNYSRIVGLPNLSALQSYYLSPNANAGTSTGAPSTDIYGVAWTGPNPDIGAGTYATPGNVGVYNPSERNASTITIAPGSTSQSIELYLGATGLTASTAGLSARYNRTRTASVNIPLIARTIGQAWISGGFAEVDAVNMPGIYRVDIPDAALAVGADDVTLVVRGASGTNGAVMTIKLSSGGLTSAETASAVWGASVAGYVTATDFGGVINETRNVVGATEAYVLDVPNQVWEELTVNHDTHGTYGWNVLRADAPSKEGLVTLHQSVGVSRVDADIHAIVNDADAASELKGALLHNGTDYISANLLTPTSPATLLRMGPYSVVADQAKQEINIDILTGSSLPIVLQLVDVTGTGIPLVGATLSVKIYNASGTLVTTYTGTASYSDAGFLTFTLDSVVTANPGTYYLTVTRTTGATDTSIYGGLRLYVRSN